MYIFDQHRISYMLYIPCFFFSHKCVLNSFHSLETTKNSQVGKDLLIHVL